PLPLGLSACNNFIFNKKDPSQKLFYKVFKVKVYNFELYKFVMKKIGDEGLGPKCIKIEPEFIVTEFVNGTTLDKISNSAELMPSFMAQISNYMFSLFNLYNKSINGANAVPIENLCINYLEFVYHRMLESCQNSLRKFNSSHENFNLSTMLNNWIHEYKKTVNESDLTIIHNDIHYFNVMGDKDSRFKLIDLENINIGPWQFDYSGFFIEMCNFDVIIEKYPSKETRKNYIEQLLKYNRHKISESLDESERNRIEKMLHIGCQFHNIFWIIWALEFDNKRAEGDFDYFGY
ncbi:MAG: hypothetical protein MHPSP_002954, partial [Paramarteilia canceri]